MLAALETRVTGPGRHLAVRGLPGSGTPAELMEAAGNAADQIGEAARDLLSG